MNQNTQDSQFDTYCEKSIKRNSLNPINTSSKPSIHLQKSYSKLQPLKRQQSLEKLIIDPSSTNNSHYLQFQPHYQQEIVNHDIQLKSYLSGQKIFKDQNQPITDFHTTNSTQTTQNAFSQHNYKLPKFKHKKQKSKSQLQFKTTSNQKVVQLERLCLLDRKQYPLKENVKNFADLNQQKFSLKKSKTLKYLDFQEMQRKTSFPTPLEVQLVLKKINEKKRISLNDIVKKLNLPKVSTVSGINLNKFAKAQTQIKKNLRILNWKDRTAQEIENKKIMEANLTAQINKLESNKIKELRKLERQIILSKIKSKEKQSKHEKSQIIS